MAKAFEGKSIFITGASSGIGAALAREFANQGGRVALAARRAGKLDEVVAEIKASGGEAAAITCDVCERASIDDAVARTVELYGGIDVAVANAGYGVSGSFESLSTDDYRRQFDTNVIGLIDTVYATLPHLRKSKGRLALISSVYGVLGGPSSSAYCASKFAVTGFAESIYYELAEKGVSVTCIFPGIIASEFRNVDNQGQHHKGDDPAPSFITMPAEKAARQMIRAIRRRRYESIITYHGKFGVFMFRHFPRASRQIFRLAVKGRMEQLEKMKRGG